MPRVLTYDADLQILRVNPAAELATLHTHIAGRLDNITLRVGQAVPLKVGTDGLALDINATFHVTPAAQGHRGADSGESLRFGLLVRGRNAEDPADPNANYTAISFSQSRAGSFMNNTDIPHGDITSEDFPLPANTTDAEGATACQTFCNAHVECVGWVYVRPPDGPRCAIKGSLDAPVPAKSCCISGVKHPGLLGTQVLIDTTRAGGDSGEGSTATIPANATCGCQAQDSKGRGGEDKGRVREMRKRPVVLRLAVFFILLTLTHNAKYVALGLIAFSHVLSPSFFCTVQPSRTHFVSLWTTALSKSTQWM